MTQLRKWHPNPNVRGRPEDYPIDAEQSEVNPLMFAGVGGAALIYGAHWVRFMPSDFRVRTLGGVAEDWPFTYEDLAPFYEYVEEAMAVAGLSGNPAYPDGAPCPLPPLPMGRVGRKAAEGMNKLGWHWWPGSKRLHRGHGAGCSHASCAALAARGVRTGPRPRRTAPIGRKR